MKTNTALALRWLVAGLLPLTLSACPSFRPERRCDRVIIETSPPSAQVWMQDETGQHALGPGPATLERDHEVSVYEYNPWIWLVAGLASGMTVGGGIWIDRAPSTDDTQEALAISLIITGGLAILTTLPAALIGLGMDGDVVAEKPREILIGAQLEGYNPTQMTITLPSKQDKLSLLLHSVGQTGPAGDLTLIIIHAADFPPVFPSQRRRYEQAGLGRIQLENRTTLPMEVDLELGVEDWAEPAHTPVKLASGEKKWVDIRAAFDEKLLQSPGPRPAQAIVQAHYVHDDVKRTCRKAFPIELLAGNAFSWREPARLGAFINGHDPLVAAYASELYREFAKHHPLQARLAHPLRNHLLAMYAFQSLASAGLRYKPDVEHPFSSLKRDALDTVQYPSETLQRKVGDCDDLVVLYCSLLESLGVPTAVVLLEGHVQMLYDTGVRTDNRTAFPVGESKTVIREGHLWVPVETTLLGQAKRFSEAWARGAESYFGHALAASDVIETRVAWADSPPATRPVEAAEAPEVLAGPIRAEAEQLLAEHARQSAAAAGKGRTPAGLLKRGAALARSGMFDQAAEAFAAAAAKRPSFQAHYGLGAALAGRGQMLKALLAFQEALPLARAEAERFRCQLAIAQCYKVDGNLRKAREHLQRALALNPGARFDSHMQALLRYLEKPAGDKAAGGEQTPRFFQEILSGLP